MTAACYCCCIPSMYFTISSLEVSTRRRGIKIFNVCETAFLHVISCVAKMLFRPEDDIVIAKARPILIVHFI